MEFTKRKKISFTTEELDIPSIESTTANKTNNELFEENLPSTSNLKNKHFLSSPVFNDNNEYHHLHPSENEEPNSSEDHQNGFKKIASVWIRKSDYCDQCCSIYTYEDFGKLQFFLVEHLGIEENLCISLVTPELESSAQPVTYRFTTESQTSQFSIRHYETNNRKKMNHIIKSDGTEEFVFFNDWNNSNNNNNNSTKETRSLITCISAVGFEYRYSEDDRFSFLRRVLRKIKKDYINSLGKNQQKGVVEYD